jgi:hypothetical protein
MFPVQVRTSPVQKIADVLRLTEQSLAAISRPIAEADGQGGLQRGRQGVERQSKPFLVELGR